MELGPTNHFGHNGSLIFFGRSQYLYEAVETPTLEDIDLSPKILTVVYT